jgi:phage terminase small subunit
MNKKRPVRRKATRALKPRELRFVEEYLLDLNGAQAAIRAGYAKRSARSTASVLLRRPEVKDALTAAMEHRSQRTGITQDRVLTELEVPAFSDISHYTIDEDGRVALAEGAPKNAMRAISKLKHKVTTKEFGKSTVTEREVEIALWDKPFTLKLAGRHVGLFPDRLEVTGKNGKPIEVEAIRQESDDELRARVAALLAKL